MNKLDALKLAQWSAVGFAGVCAGGSFFVSAVSLPSISNMKDIKAVRQSTADVMKGGRNYMMPMSLLAAASGVVAWYKSDSDYRWLYLVGADALLTLIPISLLFMSSDAKQIMKDDVVEEKGEDWVRKAVSSLKTKQIFKTILAYLAADAFILGVLLS